MIRRFQYLMLLMITSASGLYSQYYFYNDTYYNSITLVEAGISVGAMNCFTDLGGKKGKGKSFAKDLNWTSTHATGGFYVSIVYDQLFAVRAEACLGKVSASDNVLQYDHSSARDRYHRNLQFRSNIAELSITGEFFPLSLLGSESYPLFSPYLLAGVGFFRFNPQAELNGQWIDLHPLHTEGQGFKEYPHKNDYKLIQLNFPLGMGVRYEISALFNLRVEIVYRFLKTDYLDDVSTQYIDPSAFYANLNARDATEAKILADRGPELRPGIFKKAGEIRGNPQNRDSYFSWNIKWGMILNRKRR
ncbi:MAG: hypothetical protein H7122_20040 [Chitinophagaceae bacterium]|nr:hypothetical protein [Chitinophagaceae bacterium]